MRRVIASEFVSLDGVMEDPAWTFQFSSEEQEKFKFNGRGHQFDGDLSEVARDVQEL